MEEEGDIQDNSKQNSNERAELVCRHFDHDEGTRHNQCRNNVEWLDHQLQLVSKLQNINVSGKTMDLVVEDLHTFIMNLVPTKEIAKPTGNKLWKDVK